MHMLIGFLTFVCWNGIKYYMLESGSGRVTSRVQRHKCVFYNQTFWLALLQFFLSHFLPGTGLRALVHLISSTHLQRLRRYVVCAWAWHVHMPLLMHMSMRVRVRVCVWVIVWVRVRVCGWVIISNGIESTLILKLFPVNIPCVLNFVSSLTNHHLNGIVVSFSWKRQKGFSSCTHIKWCLLNTVSVVLDVNNYNYSYQYIKLCFVLIVDRCLMLRCWVTGWITKEFPLLVRFY